MPSFSRSSASKLDTCDYALQRLFNDVIREFDCTIIEGYRPPERQIELFNAGRSRVRVSKHNQSPSLAVDAAPFIPGRGIPWPKEATYVKDLAHFYYFAGFVESRARVLGVPITWGGDWDRDHDLRQAFDDLVHFQLEVI